MKGGISINKFFKLEQCFNFINDMIVNFHTNLSSNGNVFLYFESIIQISNCQKKSEFDTWIQLKFGTE